MRVVPPGGFAGFSQMTMASKAALAKGARSSGGGGRRRRRKKTSKRRARARKTRTTRKLKFGSPAWRKKYLKK